MAKERIPKDDNPGTGNPGQDTNTTSKSGFMIESELTKLAPTPGKGDRLGNLVNLGDEGKRAIPGIMRFSYVPTFGTSTTTSSAINEAGKKIYHKISMALHQRNLPFKKSDVMIHILANDSLRLAFNDMVRAYQSVLLHSKWNGYLGDRLVQAMGWDPEDILANRADMRTQLLKWAETLNDFPLPKEFTFLQLHEQMSSFIYFDTVSDKAQTYIFTPEAVLDYTGVDTAEGLSYYPWHVGDELLTWAEAKYRFQHLIDAISDSDDFDSINGALNTTYADSEFYMVTVPGEDEVPQLYHDPAAMNAIMNMHIFAGFDGEKKDNGLPVAIDSFIPKDTGSYLYCNTFPITINDAGISYPSTQLNTLTDSPTSTEMTNYARWTIGFGPRENQDDSVYRIYSWGMEVMLRATVYLMKEEYYTYKGFTKTFANGHIPVYSTTFLNSWLDAMNRYSLVAAFKNHPILTFMVKDYVDRLTLSEWNFVGKMPDPSTYHDAIVWKAFLND